jgi:TonB family protein
LTAYVKSLSDREDQRRDRIPEAFRLALQAFKDGMAAAGKGDYQTAVAHFRQAENGHPTITMSLVQHAVTKEFGESVWRNLLAYVKSLPDEAQLRPADSDLSPAYDDGLEAIGKGDYRTAVTGLRRAIRERPLRIRAHYYLGRALFHLQLYGEALTAFEELLKFDPENLLAHYEIGKLSLYAQNYPSELLDKFDPENILANYDIGRRYLSPQNYAEAIAKYQWLRSQSENSIGDLDDSDYELLPDEPKGRNLLKNPFHRAYAAKLAQYLLDLIPPPVAEQNQLPASQINFAAPSGPKPGPPDLYPMSASLRPEILYRTKAEYTEVARINRLQGPVKLSMIFAAVGHITDIRVLRGLPDGLTRRAIHAAQQIRFQPAAIDGAPVNVRGTVEFTFRL